MHVEIVSQKLEVVETTHSYTTLIAGTESEFVKVWDVVRTEWARIRTADLAWTDLQLVTL